MPWGPSPPWKACSWRTPTEIFSTNLPRGTSPSRGKKRWSKWAFTGSLRSGGPTALCPTICGASPSWSVQPSRPPARCHEKLQHTDDLTRTDLRCKYIAIFSKTHHPRCHFIVCSFNWFIGSITHRSIPKYPVPSWWHTYITVTGVLFFVCLDFFLDWLILFLLRNILLLY